MSLKRDYVPSARPIAAKEVPLVDRTEEMDILKEAVYRAVHGEGGFVLLHGEAGIGKTRLVRELGAYAQSRGVRVLYGRCPALFRMDGVPPYILWKEVIKDYLEVCSPEQLYRAIGYYPAEVAKLVPELSQKLRSIPQSLPIGPDQEQNRLFEAVSQFITNISQETPLLVILDDLQWTDPSSLLLVHYLARGVRKASLLLVGAYRSTDIDAKHPLTPVLAELKRERLPQAVSLKRMSLEDTSEMIRQILEEGDVPPAFCQLIYDKTRGNPFFVEEVIESLKEEGIVCRERNKWKIREVAALEFPETVKTVVKARLGRLNDDCRNVLTWASFFGNEFTLEAMCAVTGIEKSRLLESMDELFKTRLIKERVIRGEGICSFADVLVRDVVYEEISPLRRRELHGVVGCALETIYAAEVEEHLGELASHFLESGDNDKALGYLLKAGEKARGIYANVEAASYFQSALRLLEGKERDPRQRGHVLEQLGDIKRLVGEYDACMKYWNDALLLLTGKQEKEKTAALHRKMANVQWDKIGDAEKAKEHHDACLKILEGEPESVENARLYHDMAYMQWRHGAYAAAHASAEKALALAEKLNALDVVAEAYLDMAMVLLFSGDYKKSREYTTMGLKTALDNGYLEIAVIAYYRVASHLPIEEYEKRIEYYEQGLSLARKIGDISRQSWFLWDLAFAYNDMGEPSEAITLGEEALACVRKARVIAYSDVPLRAIGRAYQILGEWSKSESYYGEAATISGKLPDLFPRAADHLYGGLLYFDKQEYAKARESFETAYGMFERTGNRAFAAEVSEFLIAACLELGEIRRAAELLEMLGKYTLETGEKSVHAVEVALRAMLLRTEKTWSASLELFETTLTEWEAIKADIWYAYWFVRFVLCEYARAHLERNEEGDKGAALTLYKRALEMFRKMGARKDVEKVEAKMAFIETGRVISKPKPTERVSTGHAAVDNLLNGGIPQGHAVLVTSPSCDERDLLINGFLRTGAKKGEATFFVTIDPSEAKLLAEDFQSSVYLFVCNPEAEAIIKGSPNVHTLRGVENLTTISIALTSAMRQLDPALKGPRRICLDLVSDVLLYHHAVETRRWLTALLTKLKAEGFTALAVMDPEMHAAQEARAILDLFDGEITIHERETGKGPSKYLKIKRMSNQEYLKDELLLAEGEPQKRK